MKKKLAKSFLLHTVKSFLFKIPCSSLAFFLLVTCAYGQAKLKAKTKLQTGSINAIETNFKNIPDSVQTSVYWYWISGNISKEGVIKDLEAMKKVGINRAFIGNIGLDNVPGGKVKMFTPEWWEILDAALKTATRLNIQIGIFNGPGWSQSGGPWVKPAQSMRYLTSSQVTVHGPSAFHQKLVQPQKEFQDVKVLAYPVPGGYDAGIAAQFSSTPAIDSLNNLTDNNTATGIHMHNGQQLQLDINTTAPDTLRSIILTTTQQPVYLEGDVQAKVNGEYVTIKHFAIDRTNPALNTGFTPWGPAAISIPATTTTNIRLVFTRISNDCGIAELKLSATPLVEDYIEKTLAKMWPTPHPFWQNYQWASQPDEASKYIIDPNKVLDISSDMAAGGTLNWQVPAGNWIIERTGMTPTNVTNSPAPPEGQGLEIDKMSKAHVAEHFNAFLGQILKRIPPEDRKTFKVTVEDSYETGSQNWTDDLIAEFKEKYKYAPTPYMPVLQGKVVGSEDLSDRFLWDLRRLIADDVSFKYVGGLREISHKNGLTTWLENYGHWGYPGEFLQYGGQSDEVGGEFWSEGDLGDIENRAASSSAHIYGKIKVSAESFTAAGAPFYRYPAMFKKRGDRFFTEGINNTLLHVYISQPKDEVGPGVTAWFGVEFNRLNTWFFDMDVFLKYMKRCNMMLQQGQYVADVAYFIGEDAPKMIGVTDPALPQGYSYDYINGDVIKQKLTVKDGKLLLPNGISYSILVLPKLRTIRPELLAKIKELVQQGAVILGPKPDRSPSLANYPAADQQVQSTAAELWGNIDGITTKVNHYGKGLVISGMDMQQALDLVKVQPDLKITQSDSILFIHRQLKDGSIYFVSNQKNTTVNISTAFRITGKKPELWNAVTGTVRMLPAYSQNGSTTSVPMHLAPFESAFIIFRKNGTKGDTTKSNYPLPTKTINITQPWIVNFDKAMRGPAKPVVFNTLTDWSLNANDSIKYYSGTAYYHNTFNIGKLTPGAHYIIDLGLARAIAKVTVNGVTVGGAWTLPYQLDITKALKPGTNKLEIKVVNTWMNRLIGDSKLPPDQRKVSATFGPDPRSGLESSGLLGPVKIEMVKY
ncbi:glycosyl hydrolase [Mucilaginibacter sp.]|uniref:glycosyl hydrolase n=1 Tax=Mucilaginibacter sp. TaxID=1882438 RepID=UPI00284E3079|nr:glycosyl hydrolase [Mucilaginibacter sp.]MDR3695322.1 glycosyl hydrolase [Mucilaginibacter sp.]